MKPVELIERIRAGDADAEAELVARFGPRVRAFVSARLSGSDHVEDITQDTLLAAICALRDGKLRDPAMLAAFVYGIARNQLADAIRRKSRERLDPLPENREFAAPAAEREPELMEAARREIQALEPIDRKILWMTLIDGFKPGEIAASVGLNVEAVRQRKSRALKKLIEKLQPLSRTGPAVPLKQ